MKEFEQSGLSSYCLADKDMSSKIVNDIANDFGTSINPDILESYSNNLRKGVRSVFGDVKYGDAAYDVFNKLERNVSTFAAYKAFHATEQIKRQLTGKGTTEQCLSRAKAALNAFNRYQAAEYNTAISRCRTAKQWVGFNAEDNRELFPNLRWLPSRSAEQRAEHIPYYNRVWPKNDPFWAENQPGNLWNCKCDWEETGDDVDNEGVKVTPPPESLAGNPAETGEVFTDRSIYLTANNHEKVGQSILESGDAAYYEKNCIQGVKVRVHPMHEAIEIAGNMETASVFSAHNANVKSIALLPNVVKENASLRPAFYPKGMIPRGANCNADAIIEFKNGDKWLADFKCMPGNGGNLKHRLYKAYDQADYAIVKINGDIKDIIDIQNTSAAFMKSHPAFKGLVVYDKMNVEIVNIMK